MNSPYCWPVGRYSKKDGYSCVVQIFIANNGLQAAVIGKSTAQKQKNKIQGMVRIQKDSTTVAQA